MNTHPNPNRKRGNSSTCNHALLVRRVKKTVITTVCAELPYRLIWSLIIAAALLPRASLSPAADQGLDKTSPATKATSSFDEQLLEELGGESRSSDGQGKKTIDGEDIGKPSDADDPLSKIGRQMRDAQQRIAGVKADDQTQELQKEIVSNLDALIKQAQQQKKSQSSSSKASPQSQRSKPSKSKGPSDQQAGKQPDASPRESTDAPSRDSSDKLREEQAALAQRQARAEAMRGSWGRLPERAREQMLESASDEFLPKYELLLEKYFKRLGEDESAGP